MIPSSNISRNGHAGLQRQTLEETSGPFQMGLFRFPQTYM